MIQPLKSGSRQWVVAAETMDDTVAAIAGNCVLPVFVLIIEAPDLDVLTHETLAELDQRRVEDTLLNLLDDHTPPDEILLAPTADWAAEAWSHLGKEQRIPVRLLDASNDRTLPEAVRMTSQACARHAREILAEPIRLAAAMDASARAASLFESSRHIHSPERRMLYLEAARAQDPAFPEAAIELGDLLIQRGDPGRAETVFQEILTRSARKPARPAQPLDWRIPAHRARLRATFGRMMALWHDGRVEDALRQGESLLRLDPDDHGGARHHVPMLHLLSGDWQAAVAYFDWFQHRYANDFRDPAVLFAWGLAMGSDAREAEARIRYTQGMLRNLFMAPCLLELPEPKGDLWFPTDRSQPDYAYSFVDSFGSLWDQDPSSLRLVRDVIEAEQDRLDRLRDVLARLFAYSDERYDPGFDAGWRGLLAEHDAILAEVDRQVAG